MLNSTFSVGWRVPSARWIAVGLAVAAAALALGVATKPPLAAGSGATVQVLRPPFSSAVTQALPQQLDLDPRRVALGQQLFHDVRLSADDTVSCASCHALTAGGVDHRPRSVGIKGGVGAINAPTVYNSGFNLAQFWDGRAPNLEAQIDGPVQHPLEMGNTWDQVLAKLRLDAALVARFNEIDPAQGLSVAAIKDAIATFERSLITPDSRFDRFLRGEFAALDANEQRGWTLFQSYGCAACHQGVNLGGNMFEKMGLMGDYFADRGNLTEADKGRYNLTHDLQNLHEFRVPSLRNVALTAPYFHDGSAANLEQAVTIMARYQLGRTLPAEDLKDLVSFLRSLTGASLAAGQP
ncbi:MAG: hypothetical protein Fur007_11630 [Rhodoferax sp.]